MRTNKSHKEFKNKTRPSFKDDKDITSFKDKLWYYKNPNTNELINISFNKLNQLYASSSKINNSEQPTYVTI